METVTNAATTVANTASKIIFGEPQSGTEPVSGQSGGKDQPYDAGNTDGPRAGSAWSHEHTLFGFGPSPVYSQESQTVETKELTKTSEPSNVGQSGVLADTTTTSADETKIVDTTGIAPLASGGDPTVVSTNTQTASVADTSNIEPLANAGATTTAASATTTGAAQHGGHLDGTPSATETDLTRTTDTDLTKSTDTKVGGGETGTPIEKLSSDKHDGAHHGEPLKVLGQIDGNDKVKTSGHPEDGVSGDASAWDDKKKDVKKEPTTNEKGENAVEAASHHHNATSSPSPGPSGKEKTSLKDKLKEKLHIGKK